MTYWEFSVCSVFFRNQVFTPSFCRCMVEKKTCLHCGKEFHVFPCEYDLRKHCSKICRKKERAQLRLSLYEKRICPVCKKEFSCLKSHQKTHCSKPCTGKGVVQSRNGAKTEGDIPLKCIVCGKVFRVFNCDRKQKYCSHACHYVHFGRQGSELSKKKSGKSYIELYGVKKAVQISVNISLGRARRRKPKIEDPRRIAEEELLHSAWRIFVFTRDDYTCQKCGAKGELNAHHIKSWINHPELRHSVENGITLCVPCHLKMHKKKEFAVKVVRTNKSEKPYKENGNG